MVATTYTELYEIAAKNGFFVKTPTGQPYNYSYFDSTYVGFELFLWSAIVRAITFMDMVTQAADVVLLYIVYILYMLHTYIVQCMYYLLRVECYFAFTIHALLTIYCGPVIGSSSLFHVSFSRTPYRLFHVSQVDFTNAAAVKWYQEQLQGAVDLGFHGWMYDYGEYTPPDSISSDGTVGRRD